MQLHRESTQIKLLGGVKVLLILLISYTSCVSGDLTQDEITQVMNDVSPERFCGRKLTEAMRIFCLPALRSLIQRQNPVKKSCKYSHDFTITLSFIDFVFFQWMLIPSLILNLLTWIKWLLKFTMTKCFGRIHVTRLT